MSFGRIYAMFLRYLYGLKDFNQICDFFFWPAIEIGVYGLIALWVGTESVAGGHLERIFVTGLILWQVTYRANYEIMFNILDEFFEHNLSNLVATPLKLSEWIVSLMCSGLIKTIITLFFGSFVGWAFFDVNIWDLGNVLYPFVVLCILCGWCLGFLGAGIIVLKGPRFHQIPWIVITLASLFAATTYPVSILPYWMQWIAKALPMSYIFEGMRQLLTENILSPSYLELSSTLNFIYLILSLFFFRGMFNKSRERGLVA